MSEALFVVVLKPIVAATWILPFIAYFIILTHRVTHERIYGGTIYGETLKNKTNANDAKGGGPDSTRFGPDGKTVFPPIVTVTDDPLHLRLRCQQNFLESTIPAFIVLIIIELNGASSTVLHCAMVILLALRIIHADYGLMLEKAGKQLLGRPVGYFGTLTWLVGMSIYCCVLSFYPAGIPQVVD